MSSKQPPEKKLKIIILLECIQNAFLCLSRVIVPIVTRKKIVSFVPRVFVHYLTALVEVPFFFFDLEKFYNTKLKS